MKSTSKARLDCLFIYDLKSGQNIIDLLWLLFGLML